MSDDVATPTRSEGRDSQLDSMRSLLELQKLDLKTETFRARETEIPKQKKKFHVYRERLETELKEAEQVPKDLAVEQGNCESEIEQMEAQIQKYEQQLFSVKKNEEYQALLKEIEGLKKQISTKEECILVIMEKLEGAKDRLVEDRKRIKSEEAEIDSQCATIDSELAEAVKEREDLESQKGPITDRIDVKLLGLYQRIRGSKKSGAAVVALRGDTCSGCNMVLQAQTVNEILAGNKVHTCTHCGRVLYSDDLVS